MKNSILALVLCVLAFSQAFSQSEKTKKNMKNETIVLVHGAWQDASAWDAVVPLLKDKGHEVIVINLPGHGKDQTSFAKINLQTYVDAVKASIGDKKDVILVGHSMAGFVISQVAEEIPGQIKKLIYLAAYLPLNGETLMALAQKDADSHLGKNIQVDQPNGKATVAKEAIVDAFAADAPKNVAEYLTNNFPAEPLGPFVSPVNLTDAKFGSVKKIYIHTTKDNAVSYSLQQAMVKSNGHVAKIYTLPSSHTPFISMPKELSDIILTESK